MTIAASVSQWMLDSSTFIHALIVDRIALILLLRPTSHFPEYIFRVELGADAHDATRLAARSYVDKKQIGVVRLTLADLDRIAQLSTPKKIGVGELACAVIAERTEGGVLCDDRKARRWILNNLQPREWHSIDDVLVDATVNGHIGEHDLVHCQELLKQSKYDCRGDLRLEYLQRWNAINNAG